VTLKTAFSSSTMGKEENKTAGLSAPIDVELTEFGSDSSPSRHGAIETEQEWTSDPASMSLSLGTDFDVDAGLFGVMDGIFDWSGLLVDADVMPPV
jgi:hypothetical protein